MKLINEIIVEITNEFGEDIMSHIKKDVLNGASTVYGFLKQYDDYETPVLFRKVYMELFAKRSELSQDFTPDSLSGFLAEFAVRGDESWIMDVCAGSGCLLYEVNKINNKAKIFAIEYDESLVYYLIYMYVNLGIRGIVQHKDVLSGEVFRTFSIEHGKVKEILFVDDIGVDLCVSNPPFNVNNKRFIDTTLLAKKSYLILPYSCFDLLPEYRESINTIVDCGPNLFDKTSIGVMILGLKERSETTTFFDLQKYYIEETIIERRGGFDEGDKSHYGRIYSKKYNVIRAEAAKACLTLIGGEFNGLCATKRNIDIECYHVKQNINYESGSIPSVDYLNELIKEYNYIVDACESFSMTANENYILDKRAKATGILYKEDEELSKKINEAFDSICALNDLIKIERMKSCQPVKLSKSNIIQFTFKKQQRNEMFGDVSAIELFYNLFTQHHTMMNNLKNKYLSDIRDELSTLLLSGKLKL